MTLTAVLATFPIIDADAPGKAVEVRATTGPYVIVETLAGRPEATRELEPAGYSSGAAIARGLELAGWATAVLAAQLDELELARTIAAAEDGSTVAKALEAHVLGRTRVAVDIDDLALTIGAARSSPTYDERPGAKAAAERLLKARNRRLDELGPR